ncbi:MAG TPA: pyruvate dehydrogenase (acetyl-transferring) E1 component subunit alpha [Catalimonadaceae bacterium]|nr:pyruvate dehydrogenase (acetyl-transferring) E1 component subunit alpha [Catalimonadaceae bacterium]
MEKAKSKASKKTTAAGTSHPRERYEFWYESMLLIRRFEERAGQLYGQQKIKGFCHLYIGQEACASGAVSASIKDDKWITAYRDHGLPLALGSDPKALMAEMFAKATGCSKGKGGSMHFFDKAVNFMGGHGIVGAQVPMGAGIAFSEKYNKTGNVCYCYMGDGAVRQGAFHEALNMAMTWKLPVVFVIENNGYAMGTSVERTSNVTDLYKLGHAYDMPSEAVNGMSPEAVHEAFAQAAERGRKGEGPTLLELRTYRYKGHSMSDPAKYRTKEELESYKNQDPIEHVKEVLMNNGWATESDLEKVELKIKEIVNECVTFAEESPYPSVDEVYKDVYAEADYPYIIE